MKTFKPGCLLLLGIVVVLVVLDDICPLPSGCLTEWQRWFFDPHPEQTLSGTWLAYRGEYKPKKHYVRIEGASLVLCSNGVAKLCGLDRTGCGADNWIPTFPPVPTEAKWWVRIDTNDWYRVLYLDSGEYRYSVFWGMDYYGDWFIDLGYGTNDQRIVLFKTNTNVPTEEKAYFAR